jgi:hypothetical protein
MLAQGVAYLKVKVRTHCDTNCNHGVLLQSVLEGSCLPAQQNASNERLTSIHWRMTPTPRTKSTTTGECTRIRGTYLRHFVRGMRSKLRCW